jgi:hypothetical protein
MANTFTLIASVTVGVLGAATIEFTSIPGTYTDLMLLSSTRDGTTVDNNTEFKVKFNNTATSYSNKYIQGNGSAASSGTYGTTFLYTGESDGSTATINTFGSSSIYIPNYAGSNNKSLSSDLTSEENTSVSFATLTAGLLSNTAAITSIQITCNGTWAQYSTAYLYGIKNS